jgi:hypothetical protein
MLKNRNRLLLALALLSVSFFAPGRDAYAARADRGNVAQSAQRTLPGGGVIESGEPDVGNKKTPTWLPRAGELKMGWLQCTSRIWAARYFGARF